MIRHPYHQRDSSYASHPGEDRGEGCWEQHEDDLRERANRPSNMSQIMCWISVSLLFLAFFQECKGGDVDADRKERYRLGYSDNTSIALAVKEYNDMQRGDLVASQYPDLRVDEVIKAVMKAADQIRIKDIKRRARFMLLADSVKQGNLPKGSLLAFQYAGRNSTVYWPEIPGISKGISIILWSGLHQNPPEEARFNDEAYIIPCVIRSFERTDPQFIEQKKGRK